MSAVLEPRESRYEPMTALHLEAVMAIEQASYTHPWTRRNFADSLASGYHAQVLCDDEGVIGYFVAMLGVDEVHLLNITVAPAQRHRGLGLALLDELCRWSRSQGAQWLWLEVRQSNQRALQIYERYGFRRVGERRDYYPLSLGRRETAVVMSHRLQG
ncbi:MAG: ribosomal-protein-alanine N-acetyltransferase [Pseudomonadota bacterium]|jgi:ribosomal-protein-alanine N-acetyltransferase